MKLHLFAALSAAIFFFVGTSRAIAGTPSLGVLASWGGPVNAAQIVGDIAYVGSGRRVVVLDISDVEHITELSSVDVVQTVRDLAYRDGYLYVATRQKPYRFCVVDVTNPRSAHMVWTTPSSVFVGSPLQVQLRGDHAYVAADKSLWVYDISKPAEVQVLGKAILNIVHDVVIIEDLAYVAASDGNWVALKVYDLSGLDPLNPPLVGSVDVQATGVILPVRLAVHGDRAYVTHKPNSASTSLAVVDVSSPSSPVVKSDTLLDGAPFVTDIDANATHVYAARMQEPVSMSSTAGFVDWPDYPGLMIFDVTTTPDAPALVTTYKAHAGVHGVRLVGSRAYLYDHGEGLLILDVSSPASPVRMGNYHSPAFLGRMAKAGSLLYVTDYWNGLTILNVANPSAPKLVGVYQTPFGPSGENMGISNWGIAVNGTKAYLAAGGDGIHVINVSDPAAPSLIQKLQIQEHAGRDLVLRGNSLFAAFRTVNPSSPDCWEWRLRTYNVGPFAKFAVQSTLELCENPNAARVLATDGDPILYVGAEHYATQTIDVSNPASPELIYQGAEVVFDEAYDVAVEGSLWISAKHQTTYPFAAEGLYLADVSDPAKPDPLGFVHARQATAVALQNGRAYAIGDFTGSGPAGVPAGLPQLPDTGGSEVVAFNVADPANPVPVAVWPYVGKPNNTSMMIDGPHLFVATADGTDIPTEYATDQGLMILNVPLPPQAEDLNGDGIVNGFDLAMLLGAWGACPARGPCAADLNQSGTVNGFDLALLLAAWTTRR